MRNGFGGLHNVGNRPIDAVKEMSAESDVKKGDRLISILLQGEDPSGKLGNDLLREFQRGYPLSKLRRLLKSKNEDVVRIGSWIVAELGSDARPLFADIIELLKHSYPKVRFWALESIIVLAGTEDGPTVNRALDLVEDPVPGIRWKAMQLLARVSDATLQAALKTTTADQWKRKHDLTLLTNVAALGDAQRITLELESSDAVTQRYAVAAAARLANRNPAPLQKAIHS